MISRSIVRGSALALSFLAPVAALAQGVAIDHKEIGCIVAGKYPKMNACFAPASLVGKARVYFRPETLPTWYYVEMTSDAPCFSGVLLRPSKALIDKRIFYYVDVQGEGTGRTPEYGPVVVATAEECKSRLPVAPLSATGPAAVFPSMPAAGFVGGGVSTGVVAGGVAAAAVVAGGAKLLADDNNPAATTPPTVPATTAPATTPPATGPRATAPPTTPPLAVACQASPRNGEAPLRVDFATFPNGGTGVYGFEWTFGDGGGSTNPNPAHTFTAPGTFNATVRVTSGGQIALCSRPITVTSPPPGTFKLDVSLTGTGQGQVTGPGITCGLGPTDCGEAYPSGTVVTLNAKPDGFSTFVGWSGACSGTGACTVTMTADKAVTAKFDSLPKAPTLTVDAGKNSNAPGAVTSNEVPPGIICAWVGTGPAPAPCLDTATYANGTNVTLTVTTGAPVFWGGACTAPTGNTCTVLMDADKTVRIETFFGSGPPPSPGNLSVVRVILETSLEVPDGEGQVVMNGRIASAVRPGLAAMTAEGRRGANRVEAVLVRGAGRPGTWRFDLSGQVALEPGSLRVVAGTVAMITPDAVVFRLQGKPGERIVFTFEVED